MIVTHCDTKATLVSHSRMDAVPPRTLNLLSVAQFLAKTSRLTPDQHVADHESHWQYRVSCRSVSRLLTLGPPWYSLGKLSLASLRGR